VIDWLFAGVLGAGSAFLGGRYLLRRGHQAQAAHAAGLEPVRDLAHLPQTLQRTALWSLADGGFERRVIHGVMRRDAGEVDVTAFDLETLRERRGEWAWLPVDEPFRIGDVVSVVACVVDRIFPHVLFKHAGGGDNPRAPSLLDGGIPMHPGDNRGMKLARDILRVGKSYEADRPPGIPAERTAITLPGQWRVYTTSPDYLRPLLDLGFSRALEATLVRDLVIEILDDLVLIYPAQRDVVGADALADLTSVALRLVDGILDGTRPLTARGLQ
jgi:hypothetical protein